MILQRVHWVIFGGNCDPHFYVMNSAAELRSLMTPVSIDSAVCVEHSDESYSARCKTLLSVSCTVAHYRVEWYSTFLLFLNFAMLLPIRFIFTSSIPKNFQVWPFARAAKFQFVLSYRDLKMNIFFENLQISSFCLKEQSPKRKYLIKPGFELCLALKVGKNVFDLDLKKSK